MDEGDNLPEEGEITDQEDPFMFENEESQVANVTHQLATSKGNSLGGGDVEEFLKRKREELAQALNSELLDDDGDGSSPGGRQAVKERDSGGPPPAKKRAAPPSNKFYQDLDRSDEAQEALLTNWAIGAKKIDWRRTDPSDNDDSQLSDANDEYYGRAVSSASERISPPTEARISPPTMELVDETEVVEKVASKKAHRARGKAGKNSRTRRSRSRGSSQSRSEGHLKARKGRTRRSGTPRKPERLRRERPPCKFYLEGYCREGDKCLFQHVEMNARPVRGRREPQRHYAMGPPRHEDFGVYMPCDFEPWEGGEMCPPAPPMYGYGDAIEANVPPMEEVIPYARPVEMPRRKVLLGPPPKVAGGGLLPVPSSEDIAEYEKRNAANSSHAEVDHNALAESSAVNFDIGAMLRQIKAQVKGEEVQESPASPDPYDDSMENMFVVRPPSRPPLHRMVKLTLPSKAKMSNVVLNASLRDEKLRQDPRLQEYLNSQFEAVSNEITGRKAALAEQQAPCSSGSGGATDLSDPRCALTVEGGAEGPLLDPRLLRVQQPSKSNDLRPSSAVEPGIDYSVGLPPAYPTAYGHPPPAVVNRVAPEYGFPVRMERPTLHYACDDGVQAPPPSRYFSRAGNVRPPLIADPPMYGNDYGGVNGHPSMGVCEQPPANWMPNTSYAPPPPPRYASAPFGLARPRMMDPRSRRHASRPQDPMVNAEESTSELNRQNGATLPAPVISEAVEKLNSDDAVITLTTSSGIFQSLRERRKDLQYESPLSVGVGVPDV